MRRRIFDLLCASAVCIIGWSLVAWWWYEAMRSVQ